MIASYRFQGTVGRAKLTSRSGFSGSTIAQPHTAATAILVDELDPRLF
jgi:hypothetical protein